jgi:hypothetical protein
LRHLPAVGDNECDGIADVLNAVAAKDRDVPGGRTRAIGLWLHHVGLQVADMGDILAGQHQMNAGSGFGRLGRADRELRLGRRRAQHISVQRSCRRNVVGIATLAEDESFVFKAQDGSAHPEFRRDDGHGCSEG